MTRREIRDSAFKLVFEQLLRDDDIKELYEIAEEIDEITVNDEVKKIVEGTLEHASELDEIISKYSKSRSISRISKLNLAILRIALYESLYDDNTPMNAAISEAIKLSMMYTYQEDTAFINGVLGAFSRDQKKEEKKMPEFLGIDTSNYTTSAALYISGENRIVQMKKLLPVKEGELGLRQSDAVFHHTKQLPDMIEQLFEKVRKYPMISAV